MFSLYYSWVWNKHFASLLILIFFPTPQCFFGHPPLHFFYYSKYFFTHLYQNWWSQYKHSYLKMSVKFPAHPIIKSPPPPVYLAIKSMYLLSPINPSHFTQHFKISAHLQQSFHFSSRSYLLGQIIIRLLWCVVMYKNSRQRKCETNENTCV